MCVLVRSYDISQCPHGWPSHHLISHWLQWERRGNGEDLVLSRMNGGLILRERGEKAGEGVGESERIVSSRYWALIPLSSFSLLLATPYLCWCGNLSDLRPQPMFLAWSLAGYSISTAASHSRFDRLQKPFHCLLLTVKHGYSEHTPLRTEKKRLYMERLILREDGGGGG